MKIAIIGSMKFHKDFENLKKKLEKNKHQVIVPKADEFYQKNLELGFLDARSGSQTLRHNKEKNIKLKAMQDFNDNLEKSDAILVANYEKHGQKDYIGFNSIMEIGMAFNRNKKIFILFDIPYNCKDELCAIGCHVLNGDINKI